jgi:hypothetical protein
MTHDIPDERLHPVICEDSFKCSHNDYDDQLNVYPHEQSAANYMIEDQSLTEKKLLLKTLC